MDLEFQECLSLFSPQCNISMKVVDHEAYMKAKAKSGIQGFMFNNKEKCLIAWIGDGKHNLKAIPIL